MSEKFSSETKTPKQTNKQTNKQIKPEDFEKYSNVSRAANRELCEPSRVNDLPSAY